MERETPEIEFSPRSNLVELKGENLGKVKILETPCFPRAFRFSPPKKHSFGSATAVYRIIPTSSFYMYARSIKPKIIYGHPVRRIRRINPQQFDILMAKKKAPTKPNKAVNGEQILFFSCVLPFVVLTYWLCHLKFATALIHVRLTNSNNGNSVEVY